MITRRRFAGLAAGLLGMSAPAWRKTAVAQGAELEGKIVFIREGDIWEWSSEEGTRRILQDGRAMDPTWNPPGNLLLYARNGGSYSDLILANPRTGNRRRLTDNESAEERGSPEYVSGSSWAMDPFWSQADIACYVSDTGSTYGEMQLWILDPEDATAYVAPYDGNEQGPLENVSVDATATFCVYTVLASGGTEGGSTYISMRDLNVGTTYPIIEGENGAYDAAISPDGFRVVASLRDQEGRSDLWLFNRVEETMERLTEGEGASNATWSPDGSGIAYLRREGSGFELKAFRIDPATGTRIGEATRLVDATAIDATSGLSWADL